MFVFVNRLAGYVCVLWEKSGTDLLQAKAKPVRKDLVQKQQRTCPCSISLQRQCLLDDLSSTTLPLCATSVDGRTLDVWKVQMPKVEPLALKVVWTPNVV